MIQYKLDTHVHTSETSPCGKISGSELVRYYKDAGYHGLVITDHYRSDIFQSFQQQSWEEKVEAYLKGYRAACREGRKEGIRIILGMEIRFDENPNDYLIYGIDEDFLIQYPELYKLGLKKFSELAEENGILIYQAHPFRPGLTPADPGYLHGIEVFNGNARHDSRNQLAFAYAKDHKLKMLSGSDFHQFEDLARGGIVIRDVPKTSKEFVQMLNENRIDYLLPRE